MYYTLITVMSNGLFVNGKLNLLDCYDDLDHGTTVPSVSNYPVRGQFYAEVNFM